MHIQLFIIGCVIVQSIAQIQETDDDRCYNKAVDCECKKDLCRNPDYLGNMFRGCRRQCGWCEMEYAEVEEKYGRRRGRRSAESLEEVASAGQTTEIICQDLVDDCQQKTHKCSSKKYFFQMSKVCRKTCGFC